MIDSPLGPPRGPQAEAFEEVLQGLETEFTKYQDGLVGDGAEPQVCINCWTSFDAGCQCAHPQFWPIGHAITRLQRALGISV